MLMEAIDSLGLLWKWCETNRTLESLPNVSPHCAVYIQGLIRQWEKSLCAISSTVIRKGLRAAPSSQNLPLPTQSFFLLKLRPLIIKEMCAPFSNYSLPLNQFPIR